MQLTEEQKIAVSGWIDAGAKLSEIQERLGQEFDVRLTYMDVRLLVDDLKLTPKDAELPHSAGPGSALGDSAGVPLPEASPLAADAAAVGGKVSLTVDQIARPGTVASGKATFSDGQTAQWYLDQVGRLGLTGAEKGYRPPEADLPEFQAALDRELARMGL